MAPKHQPKHRAPKRRAPRRLALKRQEFRDTGSGNGSNPARRAASGGGGARLPEQGDLGWDSTPFDSEVRSDGDLSTFRTRTRELPEPSISEEFDVVPPSGPTDDHPDRDWAFWDTGLAGGSSRKTRPRSAAAEEFLKETPEFSLSRSRTESRPPKTSRAPRSPRLSRAHRDRTEPIPAVLPVDDDSGGAVPASSRRRNREVKEQRESEHQTLGQWFREIMILGLIAISSALFLTTYVVQAFFIPSESMENTLRINDRVLVNKLAYRFGEPARGDIVVFAADSGQVPEQAPDTAFARGFDTVATALGLKSSSQDLIKRVVATEGQTVEIRVGLLYVDGAEVDDEPYRKDFAAMEDFGPVTVPPDHVFVMGDNRQNSQDSRFFGPIPESSLVGKAFARIWPMERFRWLN